VKLNRAGKGSVGTTRRGRVRADFHVFCVTTAAASAPEDERVAERKAWNCMQRRALTSSSESRGLQHRRRIHFGPGWTINTAAGLYETRE
jgi:hypothetical protein